MSPLPKPTFSFPTPSPARDAPPSHPLSAPLHPPPRPPASHPPASCAPLLLPVLLALFVVRAHTFSIRSPPLCHSAPPRHRAPPKPRPSVPHVPLPTPPPAPCAASYPPLSPTLSYCFFCFSFCFTSCLGSERGQDAGPWAKGVAPIHKIVQMRIGGGGLTSSCASEAGRGCSLAVAGRRGPRQFFGRELESRSLRSSAKVPCPLPLATAASPPPRRPGAAPSPGPRGRKLGRGGPYG